MTFKQILIATDFSDSAQHALDLAIEISLKFDAGLTLVHSWEAPTYSYGGALYATVDVITPIEQGAQRALQEALASLQLRVPAAKGVLRSGPAWEEIIAAATELHADLIVVGTHGRRGLDHVLMGSVAEKVVRMAKVPVLSVHGPQKAK